MDREVAVVTGANSGIGKETSRALLKENYHLVMVCRNMNRAEAARDDIVSSTGNDSVEILICDLSDLNLVKETAQAITKNYSRLDRLVNNAGLIADRTRRTSQDGFELTFAVNHLAYFLFTIELLPILKSTPGSRIINVASRAHRYGEFNPKNLQLESGYSAEKAYGNSKLFNIMFTHQLNKHLDDADVTTFSLHPGVVNTNFASNSKSLFGWLFKFFSGFMKSPEKGAKTSIYLCTEPEIEHHSGKYFSNSRPVSPLLDVATDGQACEELWEISEKLVESAVDK